MAESFRTFCAELEKTKSISLYCNDWTALEIEVEKYVKENAVTTREQAMTILEVQKP